ncbi:MAG: hypothetical protein KF736_11845 [Acidobacteria bacterium]|nr:hypothetical protein [Acidobacteriota bacterium]MCW5948765.1 hypothetical protein [Pyrinomonadaceae bacterium]
MKKSSDLAILLVWLATLFAIVGFGTGDASAQRRDYLTDAEIELVRDNQELDKRIVVLLTAMDRRLAAVGLVPAPSLGKKETEKWGPTPTGTRLELLTDAKKILQKAIDDIDNLAERPDALVVDPDVKNPKKFSDIFPKALRELAAAAVRLRPIFAQELEKATDRQEIGVLSDLADLCDQIIEASKKPLPDGKRKN